MGRSDTAYADARRLSCAIFDSHSRRKGVRSRPAADDQDKILVMNAIQDLVRIGKADWIKTSRGDIELRLHSGQTYLLCERHVIRIG